MDAFNFDVLFSIDEPNNTIMMERIKKLPAGKHKILTYKMEIPFNARDLIAIIDPQNNIPEKEEYNNIDSIPLSENSDEIIDKNTAPMATYITVWREGESWDRSWDSNSGRNWYVISRSGASNGKYTRQRDYHGSYDYAEWDFTVYQEGTYYFWVRAYHYYYACTDVRMFWNGQQIGNSQSFYKIGGEWKWTLFGSKYLSKGEGTLRIKGYSNWYMWIDNILITANPNYIPSGKGVEGSTSHSIGTMSLGEAVDNTQLSWSTGGNANWFGEVNTYYYDHDAAQSGDIGNSQNTWIKTTVNGPGTIKFYWKVSSEQNYDYLRFYIDGSQKAKISGNVGWQQKTYTVGSGSHELMWKYTKDGSVSSGDDCGWIDKVEWIPEQNQPPATPSKPSGPTSGYVGEIYTYSTSTTDPEGDQVKYGWDWNGDYVVDEWTGYYSSGVTCSRSHSWDSEGIYRIRVKAKDANGAESGWSQSLTVTITVPQPDIEYHSCYIYDKGYDEDLIGNNNHEVNAGEFIELKVYLWNNGDADAQGVYANLSVDDEEIMMINSYEEYGDIPAGQTKACNGNYSFIVNKSHSQGYVTFTLDIYDEDGNHWTRTFDLYVNDTIPYLVYLDSSIDDSSGNDDEIVNPGETIKLSIEIFNSGYEDAYGAYAYLSTNDSLVSVTDNYGYYGTIDENESKIKSNAFEFVVDEEHPATPIEFKLDVYDNSGGHFISYFDVPVLPINAEVIKVAILADPSAKFIWGISEVFDALKYVWNVDDTTYAFWTKRVTSLSIIMGKLTYPKYDVFVYPGVPSIYRLAGWKLKWFNNTVHNFVSAGGGYVGICGGAVAASLGLYENESIHTDSFWEKNMTRTAMHLINAKVIQDFADPYYEPFKIGQGAYLYYNHNDKAWGACFNMSINTTHPIFQGYNKDYRLIRWGGGPAFHIEGDNVQVLATYPSDAITAPLHIWKFDKEYELPDWLPPLKAWKWYWAWLVRWTPVYYTRPLIPGRPDWDPTSQYVKAYIHNQPAIISSTYGQGRIIVSGSHPEFSVVSHSNQTDEADENNSNCLGSIYKWNNQRNENRKYNWWILRRMVAYVASNCPDSDLPPIEEDGWWNDAWTKRRPIYASMASGSVQDYQIKLHINYDSDMKTDFSDLRFIRYSDNVTQLAYWIEDKSDGNWADVWVKIPDEINTDNKPIAWMYYGNPNANDVSNGENVFPYFDHWNEDNTGDWIHKNTGNNHHHWWLNTKEFTTYRELRIKANLLNWWSGSWDHTQIGWSEDKTSYVNNVEHVTLYFEHRQSNGANSSYVFVKLHIRKGDNTYTTSLKSFPKPSSTDNLYIKLTYYSNKVSYEIKNMDTGQILASDSINDASKIPSPTNVKYFLHQDWDFGGGIHEWLSSSYLKWGNTQTNGGMIWKTDYWLIRKYHYPEPSYSIGNEEEQQ